MSTKSNKDTVRRLADRLWNQHDLSVIDELIAPDFVEEQPTMSGLPPGREGFRLAVQAGLAAFPDARLDIEDLVAAEDRVCIRWVFHGTHLGPLMNIPPTGRKVTMGGMYIMRLRDGRVVERWAAEDMMSLMQQLGVIPSPA